MFLYLKERMENRSCRCQATKKARGAQIAIPGFSLPEAPPNMSGAVNEIYQKLYRTVNFTEVSAIVAAVVVAASVGQAFEPDGSVLPKSVAGSTAPQAGSNH